MKAKKYTIEEATKNFSDIIREAENGMDLYITRDGKPLVKVVRIAVSKRVPGGFEGKIWCAPDAFDPLTDEEMKELGFE